MVKKMSWDFLFFFNSSLLGIGLAMDAFSVAMANGLNEPNMARRKLVFIAGVFAVFQGVMPLAGWILIKQIAERFSWIEKSVPYLALIILSFIGIKMIIEGVKENKNVGEEIKEARTINLTLIIVQGFATSLDALSVGFTIEKYIFIFAFVSSLIIAIETFFICLAGVVIGKRFGMQLAGKSSIFGGGILVLIGIEILISSLL